MIPLRDNIPHMKPPYVTVGIIVVNVLVFLYEVSLGNYLKEFLYHYGFIPRLIFSDVTLSQKVFPVFTSMFMHAGWLHLIGNMWFLWIFADNVEDEMGHFNFLVFYLLCGLTAALTHFIMNFRSTVPTVGASGAIAGVLGAYILMFPSARVLTLLPIFIFFEIVEIPAFIYLGVWFIYQFLLGLYSLGETGAGIAFWAHIGGFVAGMYFLRFFRKGERYYYRYY